MGLEGQEVPAQARLRAGGLETVELDWSDDFLESWRTAAEALREDESTPGVLVTREICQHVLGWSLTDSNIEKTRRRIEEWLNHGIVERVKTKRVNISGYPATLPGFRLVSSGENEQGDETDG